MTVSVDINMPGNMASGWYIASDTRCISVLKLFMPTLFRNIRCSNNDGCGCNDFIVAHVFNHNNVFIIHVSLALYLYLVPCTCSIFSESFTFCNIVTQTTTSLDAQCISNFTGSSAACPLASGVIALALEVK